ncbi:hypothetical protein HPB51_021272 [Rhipicephalus microplus]|uniref:Uncharacterized protein n=1 Tax=Rhipicephalus microplus TaxID=6941 RepID=A0A9J6F7Y8_RHIMP|nr:hypothetical protein HPB51_021272 [Rhipicephalus microplus]
MTLEMPTFVHKGAALDGWVFPNIRMAFYPIVALQFSPNGRYMAVAAGKHILLFNNVPGYQNAIDDLEERKKGAASASIRDRLQTQIDEARSILKTMEAKES